MSGPYGYIGPQVMPPNLSAAGHLGLDPSSNNQPLQFNTTKGKPPMAVMGRELNEEQKREQEAATSPTTDLMSQNMMNPNMMGYAPMMGGHMAMQDPNMAAMLGPMGFNQYTGYMNAMTQEATPTQKEIITFKFATLYPPPPNAPSPTTRERPPGCRTIFVGGLPENSTEEMIQEIFETCGPICSIRLSKKNFSHIRFEMEESVDKALYISGYRMKIDNKDDKPNTGRLHCDYAQARDDLYEWECKQRALARENRHRVRIEEELLRPPSPPPIIHFSDHEASVLQEHLKGDDTFMKATQVMMTWLDRGDCNRRTANTFYSMVQSVNSHTRRLLNEKAAHDQELEAVKLNFKLRHEGILRQFEQIDKVFGTCSKQKAWDHFSKAQRKNLDMWRKQAQEMLNLQKEEFLKDRQEAEMEMSDSEEGEGIGTPVTKKFKRTTEETLLLDQNQWLLAQTREENDQLKCQLEAYKNEVDLVKSENTHAFEEKEKQIHALQKVLQGMQQQLVTSNQEMKKLEEKQKVVNGTKEESLVAKETSPEEPIIEKVTVQPTVVSEPAKPEAAISVDGETPGGGTSTTPIAASSKPRAVDQREAKLIGLICTFLHVHPFGASTEYIGSYLHRLDFQIRTSELEELLERLPSIFRQDYHGIGASIEKRWKFIGLDIVKK